MTALHELSQPGQHDERLLRLWAEEFAAGGRTLPDLSPADRALLPSDAAAVRAVYFAWAETLKHGGGSSEWALELGQWTVRHGLSQDVLEDWTILIGFKARGFIEPLATVRAVLQREPPGLGCTSVELFHLAKLSSMFKYRSMQQFLAIRATGQDNLLHEAYDIQCQLALGGGEAEVPAFLRLWESTERVSVRNILLAGLFSATGMAPERQGQLLIDQCFAYLDQRPADHVAHYRLARAYRLVGQFHLGLRSIDRALELNTANQWAGPSELFAEQYHVERILLSIAEANENSLDALRVRAAHLEGLEERLDSRLHQSVVRATEIVALFSAVVAFVFSGVSLASDNDTILNKLALLTGIGVILIGFLWLVHIVIHRPST